MARKRAKKSNDFYSKPVHVRLGQRIFEGLLSSAAVYLLAPKIIPLLAPLQAQINTTAATNGATISNVGTNTVANQLIQAAAS